MAPNDINQVLPVLWPSVASVVGTISNVQGRGVADDISNTSLYNYMLH